MPIDIDEARMSLSNAAERASALVRSAPDPLAAVPGSDWNFGDVAAHMVLISEVYTEYALGSTKQFMDVSDIAGGSLERSSLALIESEPERDLPVLANRLSDGVSSLVRATQGRSNKEVVMWNGRQLGLGALVGVALGEYLLHGRDLARVLSRSWTIDADDARLVLASTLPELPLLVNRAATAKANAAYDLRVRGGIRLTVRIDDGQLTVEAPGGAVDCHLSAEPVALLLVAYGRCSQWLPALSGKLAAWGRRPWLGLRLTHYLVPP